MDTEKILAHCDHTLLKQESTWEQIREVCDDGLKYRCASVCIPASYVRRAAEHVGNALKICTVIGFPNGYSTTAVKVFETEDAIRNGADEIDMVINIGWVKDRRWEDLLTEIKAVKASCQGRILKVIVEACLLTEEEKIKMWRDRHRLGRGIYQDLYRLFHRRGHPGGCGPLRQAHRIWREDQGGRRHLHSSGRGGLSGAGRGPSGNVPDRQAGEGTARGRILNDRTGCGSGETGAGPLMRLILLKQFCKLF